MRLVIAVSSAGRAFQLEDDAHALLAKYQREAESTLHANADEAEILRDRAQDRSSTGTVRA